MPESANQAYTAVAAMLLLQCCCCSALVSAQHDFADMHCMLLLLPPQVPLLCTMVLCETPEAEVACSAETWPVL